MAKSGVLSPPKKTVGSWVARPTLWESQWERKSPVDFSGHSATLEDWLPGRTDTRKSPKDQVVGPLPNGRYFYGLYMGDGLLY